MNKKKACKGCLSIENDLFPFLREDIYRYHKKGPFINQEGCGVDGDDYLKIYFCPVCGKKIE